MNTKEICLGCMNEKVDENGMCPVCHTNNNEIESNSRHLPLRFILKGKYLIGKVIGEGGFGITYVGYDLDLEIRVAIKEFFPRQMVGREVEEGFTVCPFDSEEEEIFVREREKFIDEARRLAKFRSEKNVVSVLDYFQENSTAYIVMDYIDGTTLRKYVKARKAQGRHMDVEECLALLNPLMETLDKMHETQLIHRDISPDNIMVDFKKNEAYLIDFGSARNVEGEHSKSVHMKGSFTPIEQMSRRGNQGPWTDVYALCATIYWCITGRDIPDAIGRMGEDTLVRPSSCGVKISAQTEFVLMNGLAVYPEERYQSVRELIVSLIPATIFEETIKNMMMSEDKQETKEEIRQERVQEKQEYTPLYAEQKTTVKKKNGPLKVILAIIIIVGGICFGGMLSEQYRNRKETTTYDNGDVLDIYFENGKPVCYKRYNSNNRLIEEKTMHDDDNYSLIRYTFDENGNRIRIEEYENDQRTSTMEMRDGKLYEYDYESNDTFYVIGTDVTVRVEEGWFKSGEWETYVFYNFPEDGWHSETEYVLGDGNDDNYTTYFFDEAENLIYEMVIVNDQKASEKIHNQEKFNSINWGEN